ncbi:MerR family transcriptional regulator [Hasllibacter halocynthiae]|uniref:MerR family transcriptional regulator n=1 Tax=Hasllibacter halocynthiae TaxID=595589 RepID=A0A2T0X6H4_9RHOB|nr:MerR family DNA-binding transcriptional regulator [Hasllibacter halocynthiae]PRY94523.1 MerR family transcriptional regulator [Hasllibacter halocynthiae]
MASEVMTIREMCEAYDVTPRTLRFYESKELLSPIREGQRRLFTRRDRARLQLILQAKRFGFSLEQIRQLLDLYGVDPSNAVQVREAVAVGRERLAAMEAQQIELGEAIADLREHIDRGEAFLAKRPGSKTDAA